MNFQRQGDVDFIWRSIHRLSGSFNYRIKLDQLDDEGIRELRRLLDAIQVQSDARARLAQMHWWRRA